MLAGCRNFYMFASPCYQPVRRSTIAAAAWALIHIEHDKSLSMRKVQHYLVVCCLDTFRELISASPSFVLTHGTHSTSLLPGCSQQAARLWWMVFFFFDFLAVSSRHSVDSVRGLRIYTYIASQVPSPLKIGRAINETEFLLCVTSKLTNTVKKNLKLALIAVSTLVQGAKLIFSVIFQMTKCPQAEEEKRKENETSWGMSGLI